jgi:hypothetical protein
LQGFTENSSSDAMQATTVRAFMLSSMLSKQKDVAALLPVKNMDVSFLRCCAMKAYRFLLFISFTTFICLYFLFPCFRSFVFSCCP